MAAKPLTRRMPSPASSNTSYFPQMIFSSEPARLFPAPASRWFYVEIEQEEIDV